MLQCVLSVTGTNTTLREDEYKNKRKKTYIPVYKTVRASETTCTPLKCDLSGEMKSVPKFIL